MRLTIEEKWWSDPRRTPLTVAVGCPFRADGLAMYLWRTAQEYWKDDCKPIPAAIFKIIPYSEVLISLNLVVEVEGGFYAEGSKKYLTWAKDQHESVVERGRKGGRVSAQRPRDKNGHFLPKNVDTTVAPQNSENENFVQATDQAEIQANAKQTQAEPSSKPSKPKRSGSGSGSNSGLEPKNLCTEQECVEVVDSDHSPPHEQSSFAEIEKPGEQGKVAKKAKGPSPPKIRKPRQVFKIESWDQLRELVPEDHVAVFNTLYPDPEFLGHTGIRCVKYYTLTKPSKAPKTLDGWIGKLDFWFNKHWPDWSAAKERKQ